MLSLVPMQATLRAAARPVLVVEDDPDIRAVVRDALEGAGYAVLEAADGAEALRLVRMTRPAAVLLDVDVPVLDGPGFAAAYRALPGPHAPLVVMTGAARARRWTRELAADGVLPKPFERAELYAAVAAVA
jgi:CheY-like chemotaxis protein